MAVISEKRSRFYYVRTIFEGYGSFLTSSVDYIGGIFILAIRAARGLFVYKFEFRELIYQFLEIGNKSLFLVGLIAIFTGLVMALQLSVGLGRFGLKLYVGQVVGLAIFRELGPVLTALMIAARVGSGITAELGSMVVTEQVLAIEAMGANPIQKLVVPRVLATIIAAPLLTVMADVLGVLGGMVITMRQAGVSASFYIDQVSNTILIDDFLSGVIKAIFFGFFISLIACYQGLATGGGTEGVGRSTTQAVVYASIVIFISDFFLTKFFLFV